jgi:hypothetical protein
MKRGRLVGASPEFRECSVKVFELPASSIVVVPPAFVVSTILSLASLFA